MIQNFITDPLLHNYMAPCYPIFIQIRYLLGTITNKKSMKTAKNDIVSVKIFLFLARHGRRTRSLKIRLIVPYGDD
jgi:hypothetical protein